MNGARASCWSLAPLALYAAGTGDVEAQSSLVARSALCHSVKSITLLTQVILRKEILPRQRSRLRLPLLHTINGYCKCAETVANRLKVLMAHDQAYQGTLLVWSEVLNPMGHQLLHQARAWCPHCLKEDEEQGRVPYQRLYWCLRPVRMCVRHRTPLVSRCPVCDASQAYVPSLPFQDSCGRCGAHLTAHEDGSPTTETIDWWKAWATYELLAQSYTLSEKIPHKRFLQWIDHLCKHHANGRPSVLARMTGLYDANLKRWISGETKPSLDLLLDFCYALRCPPASIITGQPHLSAIELLRAPAERRIAKRRLRSRAEVSQIEANLQRLIRNYPTCMPSLNEVARRHKCKRAYLLYRFPGLSQTIKGLAANRRQTELQRRRLAWKSRLAPYLRLLQRRGTYPSDRHLMTVGVSRQMLVDPGCRELIKAAREQAAQDVVRPRLGSK